MDSTKGIAGICSSLCAGGYSVTFHGFSAVDRYLGLPALPFLWAQTNADIAVLARFVENLRFPGVEIADAAVDTCEGTFYFRCLDSAEPAVFPLLSLSCDWQTMRFQDPLGVYPVLRGLRGGPEILLEEGGDASVRAIMDASLMLARYNFSAPATATPSGPHGQLPAPELQRAFLSCLLASARPDKGFEFLKRSGLLAGLWPELACLDDVDHSKEFHPEGNVWNHTLETFRYRKASGGGTFDLRLSLGLLLHDAGKPISASSAGHRFDGHAELGARAAARFLERLEFEPSLIRDVFYLVKNHMLPAALKRLPLTKTAEIMASPLFPTLMELYRCDESSSFKGLDSYYENSAAYQTYLKNVKNPYRYADGKKVGKRPRRA
ncbi:MAG: HD domain-containing protein [Treponema sp.]|nr:HD domain-containing protein [Treponema sp.]